MISSFLLTHVWKAPPPSQGTVGSQPGVRWHPGTAGGSRGVCPVRGVGVGRLSSPSVWVRGPCSLSQSLCESWVQTSRWRQHPSSPEARVAGLGLARCARGGDIKGVDSLCRPGSGLLSCLSLTLPPALLPGASTWHHKQKHWPEISADRAGGLGRIA